MMSAVICKANYIYFSGQINAVIKRYDEHSTLDN